MKLISRLRDHRYCAFCKVLRRVYVKKHIDLTNVLGAAVFALLLSHLFWGSFDPRAIAFFVLMLTAGEVFIFTRWRASLICRLCGFDPVVYKRSPAEASLKVKEFFKEQSENPEFMLTRSPLLDVQRKIRLHEQKKQLDR